MLITADWVLPVESPPLRNGAVHVRADKIAEIGPAERFADSHSGSRVDLPGCILAPGLINAHTHLSLTALEGAFPPRPFVEWLAHMARVNSLMTADDHAVSAALGVLRCLHSGITAVGDIAYGPEAPATAADMGLGGVFFWEVLGISAEKLHETLRKAEFPLDSKAACAGRVRCGLSPHSPYACGPGLLRAMASYARENAFPLAVHVAESAAEVRAVSTGEGPLAAVAKRLAPDFEPAGMGPVAYLAALGVLDDAVAVHCVHLSAGEAHTLARTARGAVLCPRSNAYLHNGSPPAQALRRAKVTIALGTDSAASNQSIDLCAEARAVRDLDPRLSAADSLRMMTLDGARVLGIDGRFGSIAPGKQADLVAVRVQGGETPEEAFVGCTAASVDSVMSGGTWRIRDGRTMFTSETMVAAARRVAQRVTAGLANG